ncbi:MAG: nitroreductase family protein [Mycobacteriales bacterium]
MSSGAAVADDPSTAGPHSGVVEVLRQRRSRSVFDPDLILSDNELRVLLEAARWAPSAGNSQPWRFLVGRRGDAAHRRIVAALSRGNLGWAPAASAILITLEQTATDPGSDLPYSDYAAYDLGQAAAHLTVQAQSMGLWTHQFAGFDHDRIAADFRVPDNLAVRTGIAVGRPLPEDRHDGVDELVVARERRPRQRKPVDELLLNSDALG